MKTFIRVGVDLAKNYFQIHALTDEGAPAVTRKLRRSNVLEFSRRANPAAPAWRHAARRVIGRANLSGSGTMCF